MAQALVVKTSTDEKLRHQKTFDPVTNPLLYKFPVLFEPVVDSE